MQSDERLSKLFTRGVDPAFDELVRRYRGSLTVFAGGIVGRDRAEDVVQESLVKAHRSMAAEEVAEPRAWLYKVVRNTALNEIRDGAKHDHAELTDRAAGHTADQAAEEAERREELSMLISALAELPETQRTALVGRELGGYTHDELAERLGVSRGATKQLIFRARTGLRNALGALFPMPLIVWLASDATGTFVASGAGTATAAGVAGVAGGAGGAAGGAAGATGAAAGGGLFAGLAGGGAAKVAAVAAVAGGTVAAGVAVEERVASEPDPRPAVVRSIDSPGVNPGAPAPALAGSGEAAGSRKADSGAGGSSEGEDGSSQDGSDSAKPPGGEAAGKDAEDVPAPGDGSETGVPVAIPGKGFGKRPGGGRPWKVTGAEKPWKASGAEKPWKQAGAEKPWKASGAEKPWKASGAEKPWKQAGAEKPWKQAGAEKPWKASGAEKPWKALGSGKAGSSGGSSAGSGSGSTPSRPSRPWRPSSSGSGAKAQSSPSAEVSSPRPGGGRLGSGKRSPGS